MDGSPPSRGRQATQEPDLWVMIWPRHVGVKKVNFQQILIVSSCLFLSLQVNAAPHFIPDMPLPDARYEIDGPALCATATQTLAYLNRGTDYDPQAIHPGKALPISLARIKATLRFICQNKAKFNDPGFVKQNFDFIRWNPDLEHARRLSLNKPLLKNLPSSRILMTKYYVHLAKASINSSSAMPYAIHALPEDERGLSLEQVNTRVDLQRLRYGKQAILSGVLKDKHVPVLAYVSRDDLESALMQGTIVADFGAPIGQKTLNVYRNNGVEYDRLKSPYEQERYWYFKEVDGIKGYGKDANYKITINAGVTFAADLTQFGLGKLLMVQYPEKNGAITTRAGIFADTGGAFAGNLYQVDYLSGAYPGKEACLKATRHLPDYVNAWFMVLKPTVQTLVKT